MKNQILSENNHPSGVFTQALQDVATLQADKGASMSRIIFASDHIAATKTNMESAKGRIIDVDIAYESTRLAKNNVMIQISASMRAHANTPNEVALMLIR